MYPTLEWDELIQEARFALWQATLTFKGLSRFVTYAYEAIRRWLLRYASREARHRRGDALDEDSVLVLEATCEAETGYPELLDTLRDTTDSHLLLIQAAGYTDGELNEVNVRVRRHRARKTLLAELSTGEVAA